MHLCAAKLPSSPPASLQTEEPLPEQAKVQQEQVFECVPFGLLIVRHVGNKLNTVPAVAQTCELTNSSNPSRHSANSL